MKNLRYTIYTLQPGVLAKAVSTVVMAMTLLAPVQTVRAETQEAVSDALLMEDQASVTPSQPTVQDVLLQVCQAEGYDTDCAKVLLGMLWNESSNVATAIGDGGKARGYFQIHYKLHKISISCAEDLECSAKWSLAYLERNRYPKYVSYAVQCHNSCNVNNGYAAKALRNGTRLWNQPLTITPAPSRSFVLAHLDY